MVLWSITVVIVAIGFAPVRDRSMVKWSLRFNVLIADAASERWLVSRLRRAKVIRWTTFALGINIGMLPMYMNVIDVERAAEFSNDLTAYAPYAAAALGAVLAEVSLVRPPKGTRYASMVTRRWTDYIERFWLVVIASTLPLTVVASWLALRRFDPDWWWVAPLGSALAITAATIGVHVVVNRPTNAFSETTRRLDDALRADGAHHVVGASVAMAGLAALHSINDALGTSAWNLLPVLLMYAVLGSWYGIACTTRWNVDQVRLQHA